MPEFDAYSENYSQSLDQSLAPFGGFDAYYHKAKVSLVEGWLRERPIRSVLDFGCGIGRATTILKSAYPSARVVGVDISSASLELAKKNNPDVEFNLFGASENFAPLIGQFDVIYVANVFHHVPVSERKDLMLKVTEFLSETGTLFFFEHNPKNPATRWVVSRCEFDKDAVLLSDAEAVQLVQGSGLHVEATRYLLFFPYLLRSLQFLERHLETFPFGAQYCIVASKQNLIGQS